jgi:hypothetical protein
LGPGFIAGVVRLGVHVGEGYDSGLSTQGSFCCGLEAPSTECDGGVERGSREDAGECFDFLYSGWLAANRDFDLCGIASKSVAVEDDRVGAWLEPDTYIGPRGRQKQNGIPVSPGRRPWDGGFATLKKLNRFGADTRGGR